MVSISHEHPVETERRLREVIRAAEVVHLEGAWCFRHFSGGVPNSAVAAVRDDDGWCALLPGAVGDDTSFGLTVTHFSPAIENSGFVGWLATLIKRETGSGVFVVCGDNPQRGGIFDYLGYPISVADAVRQLIEDLRKRQVDPFELDLSLFSLVERSPSSAVSDATVFEFREANGVVEARYSGGEIVTGFLVGRRRGDRVATAYSQLHDSGEVRSGTADIRIAQKSGGRLRLIEDFRWSDGAAGRNVLASVERRHEA